MATKKAAKKTAKKSVADRVREGATRLLMRGSSTGKGRETSGTMGPGRNLDRYLEDIENGGGRSSTSKRRK